MADFTDKIFKVIDDEINTANSEVELWGIYSKFWMALKVKTGTSSGYTGLSDPSLTVCQLLSAGFLFDSWCFFVIF